MKLVLNIILIIVFALSASNSLLAQVQGKFGSNQSTRDVNAVLEAESTSKGVLLPRLTTAQQNAMSAPTNGMLIYNTDSACFVLRRAGVWRSLCAPNGGEAWSTLGNTGMNANTNFLGTTDYKDLVFRTNNTEKARLTGDGYWGLGSTNPVARMHIINPSGWDSGNDFVFDDYSSGTTGPAIYLRRARGSLAAPLSVVSGDTLGRLAFDPYLSGAFSYSGGTHISALYKGNGTNYKTNFMISTSNTERMVIDENGNMGLGLSTPQYKLDIDAKTASAGNPLRLLGLNAGATSDSIISSNAGVLKRLSINQVIANAWNITGNSNTLDDGTYFIGTTNNIPLSIKVNGQKAGRLDATGVVNLGYQSGNVNTAANITALGYQSGLVNSTGLGNTFIGYQSGIANTTGAYNHFSGYQAGLNNQTGTGNTLIGYQADVSTTALTNAMAIGNGATVNASNKIRLGNATVSLVETYGSFTTISDKRLKTNINDNFIGLNFIKAVRPVQYELKSQKGVVYDGFIAQEIDSILQKQGIKSFSGVVKPSNTEGSYYTVSYSTFVVPLVNAVKELDALSEQLKVNSDKLATENAALKAELDKLKKDNAALKTSVDKNSQDIEAIKAALTKKQN